MREAPRPVLLEVLARVPSNFLHCSHCERLFAAARIGRAVHEEMRASYPEDTLEEADRLAAWIRALSGRYGGRIEIRVVDVQSMEGFLRSLRHRVRQYPAFIVNGKVTHTGWERASLDSLLAARLEDDGSNGQR
ncbi:MAG: hypothetical protein PVF54_00895 [Anaerolineae bacterium]|jgi:hypothetical protein